MMPLRDLLVIAQPSAVAVMVSANSRDAFVGYINAERHLGVPADGDPYVEGS
jgi:hypothetical protein